MTLGTAQEMHGADLKGSSHGGSLAVEMGYDGVVRLH